VESECYWIGDRYVFPKFPLQLGSVPIGVPVRMLNYAGTYN
jgi:hypothetical protein